MNKVLNRISLVVLTCLISLNAFAQTSQKGLVKEYREGNNKRLLSGVEVEIVNAGSVVSDNKGNFLLEFRTLKPGQKVNVRRIEKIGYEIFNKEALEQWNINPDEPFTIVMVKSELFKKIKDQYSIMSSKSYAQQYEKEKQALEAERKAGKLTEKKLKEELQALSDWYDKQLDNLSNYVDRFARIDIGELDENERNIIELVKSGKIEEAIKKYEDFKLVEKFEAETSEKRQIDESIKTLSEHQLKKQETLSVLWEKIKLQMDVHILKGSKKDYEKVSELLLRVASADSSNHKILCNCAVYASMVNLISTQMQIFQMCDWNAIADPRLKLQMELGYASSLTITGRYDDAIPYLKNAMNEAEALNDFNSRYRAIAGLVSAYSWKMDMDNLTLMVNELFKYYDDKSIYEAMSKKTQAQLNRDIATYYSTLGDYPNTIKYFANATDLYADIYTENPIDKHRTQYAGMLVSLSVSYMLAGDVDSAVIYANKAKNLIEESALENNPAYVYEYYQAIKTLATCSFYKEDYVGSEAMFANALKIAESVSSDMFIIEEKTDLYNNFGYLYYVTGQYEKSEKMYLMAHDICYDAYLENLEKYIFNLFRVQINLSSLYLAMEKHELAIKYGEDAVVNCEIIYSVYPDFIRDNYVLVLQNIAQSAAKLGKTEYAASTIAKALEIKPGDSLSEQISKSLN